MANDTSIKFPEPGTAELKSKAGRAHVASSSAPAGGYDIHVDFRNGSYVAEHRYTFSDAVLYATALLANLQTGKN